MKEHIALQLQAKSPGSSCAAICRVKSLADSHYHFSNWDYGIASQTILMALKIECKTAA